MKGNYKLPEKFTGCESIFQLLQMRKGNANQSMTKQLAVNLANLIRYNNKLQHLDLSATGLNA